MLIKIWNLEASFTRNLWNERIGLEIDCKYKDAVLYLRRYMIVLSLTTNGKSHDRHPQPDHRGC